PTPPLKTFCLRSLMNEDNSLESLPANSRSSTYIATTTFFLLSVTLTNKHGSALVHLKQSHFIKLTNLSFQQRGACFSPYKLRFNRHTLSVPSSYPSGCVM